MKTSEEGLNSIVLDEGCRLVPYADVAEFWTVGVGHKLLLTDSFPESGVTNDQVKTLVKSDGTAVPEWRITKKEAMDLLAKDVESVENYLNFFLRRNQLTLSQNRFDALVNFGFNAGVASLGQLLSHGLDKVSVQLGKWIYAGGKISVGLVARRDREIAMWNKG